MKLFWCTNSDTDGNLLERAEKQQPINYKEQLCVMTAS